MNTHSLSDRYSLSQNGHDGGGTATANGPRRSQHERGAVAVELALVVLLLVGMLAGVVDYSSLLQAKRDISDATRSAARSAAQACNQAAGCSNGNPIAVGDDSDDRVQLALREMLGARGGNIQKVIIFKASAASDAVPPTCLTTTIGIAGLCNVTLNPLGSDGTMAALNKTMWKVQTRNRQDATADYVGVHIEYTHRTFFGMFGRNKQANARATFRLEPPILAAQSLNPLPLLPAAPPDTTYVGDPWAPAPSGPSPAPAPAPDPTPYVPPVPTNGAG